MSTISTLDDITFSKLPAENFLFSNLQKELKFQLGTKTIKTGKLILFKRSHFFVHVTLVNTKKEKENFEIPFPFKVEEHYDDGIVYFDYRIESLNTEAFPLIKNKVSSSYFNKILEISVKS